MSEVKTIHNASTGEVATVPLTAEDIEIAEITRANWEARKLVMAQAEAKRAAALAKLEALGLDEDDLKALGL